MQVIVRDDLHNRTTCHTFIYTKQRQKKVIKLHYIKCTIMTDSVGRDSLTLATN